MFLDPTDSSRMSKMAPAPTNQLLLQLPEPAKLLLADQLRLPRHALDQLGLSLYPETGLVLHLGCHAWLVPSDVFKVVESINLQYRSLEIPAHLADLEVARRFEDKERLRRKWESSKFGADRQAKRRRYSEFLESLTQFNKANDARDEITMQLRASNDAFARLFQRLTYIGDEVGGGQDVPGWYADDIGDYGQTSPSAQFPAQASPFAGSQDEALSPLHQQEFCFPRSHNASRDAWSATTSDRACHPSRQPRPPLIKRVNASHLTPLTSTLPIMEVPEPEQPRVYSRNSASPLDSVTAMPTVDIKHDAGSDTASTISSEGNAALERSRRASFPGFDNVNKVLWLPAHSPLKQTLLPHRRTASEDQVMVGLGLD